MNNKILKNIFDNLESSLKNEMRIRIEHNLEDGKYREYLVKRILSKIVPSKYEITNPEFCNAHYCELYFSPLYKRVLLCQEIFIFVLYNLVQ